VWGCTATSFEVWRLSLGDVGVPVRLLLVTEDVSGGTIWVESCRRVAGHGGRWAVVKLCQVLPPTHVNKVSRGGHRWC
jgi:hypothetical protein